LGAKPNSRREIREIVEAISRCMGEGVRGPDPFAKAAGVWEQLQRYMERTLREIGSELDCVFPAEIWIAMVGQFGAGRRELHVTMWRGFEERPAPVLEGAGFGLGAHRVRYPRDFLDVGGVPRLHVLAGVEGGEWRFALFPIVEVVQKVGGSHDGEDLGFATGAFGRILTARGFQPTRQRLQELTGGLLCDGELSPIIPRRLLVRRYKATGKDPGQVRKNKIDCDDERTKEEDALAWIGSKERDVMSPEDILLLNEIEAAGAGGDCDDDSCAGGASAVRVKPLEPLSVRDRYDPKTQRQREAVRIAERCERYGFSVRQYVRRTQGKRADSILRRLSRCSRRRRKARE